MSGTGDSHGIFSPEELKEMSNDLDKGVIAGESKPAREKRARDILQRKEQDRE